MGSTNHERASSLWSLVTEHGMNTPLYRADHLGGDGHRPEAIDLASACEAALKARVGGSLHALREQLLALDVVADQWACEPLLLSLL